MLGFSPFKKHANKFSYIPRYYSPEKEAREERRAELHGERTEDSAREFRPGQFIRTQREARAARRDREESQGRKRVWTMAVGAVVVLLFIYLLYPRLADLFLRMTAASAPRPVQTERVEAGEFDPMAPITIVPNDYQEEK